MPNQPRRPSPQPENGYELPPAPSSLSSLPALEALEADQVERGRCSLRFGRGVNGPIPVCRTSSSGNAKSRILTRTVWEATAEEIEALRAACCCDSCC